MVFERSDTHVACFDVFFADLDDGDAALDCLKMVSGWLEGGGISCIPLLLKSSIPEGPEKPECHGKMKHTFPGGNRDLPETR